MPSPRVTIRDHSAEANLFLRRSIIAIIFMFIATGVLLGNLYHLQVTRHDDYQTRSNDNRIKVLPVAPTRGLIYDRNGVLLAENKPVFRLELVPEQIDDLPDTLASLTKLLKVKPSSIARFKKDMRGQRRFKPLALIHRMTPEQVAIFSAHQYKYPGVSVEARLKRYYPFGDTLTHVLGYVARINQTELKHLEETGQEANYAATYDIGKLGVEKYHETLLHGKVGYQEVEVNSRGRIIRTLKFQPPVPGKNIYLNIDIRMQQIAQEALGDNRGSVVVIDPRDGGVMTLYSNPSYDPNLFVHGISSKDYQKLRNADSPLLNRATKGLYPPASTVKPLLAVIGLDEGLITPKTRVFDTGSFKIKNVSHVWRDWKPWGHGWMNVTQAIEQSCDTYFYDLAYKLGIDRISSAMHQFGFGERTGIDLYEEKSAIMPNPGWKRARYNKPWYLGDTIPVGIGQGYWSTTPLQLTKAITTLVDRGHSYVPQVIRGVIENGKRVPFAPTPNKPIILNNDKNWDIVLDAMYGVVNRQHGTARKAFANAKYISAGKSGTAQLFSIGEDEKYEASKTAAHLRDNAMYVGFAPYKHPQLVMSIVVENAGHGGAEAAPIARKIMDYYLVETHHADKQQPQSK